MTEYEFIHDNPLSIHERMAVFEAIRDSNITMISDRFASVRDLMNVHWDLNKRPEVSELLWYCPTALSMAAYLGSREIVTYLLSNGADPAVPDRVGFSFIMFFRLFWRFSFA
jgi:ankyrin repeat protein